MKVYTTTITSKGQITVPAAFRRQLGIGPGETLKVSLKGNKVVAEKDEYWEEFGRLQQIVQAHRQKHKTAPLTESEINDLRGGAWQSKL